MVDDIQIIVDTSKSNTSGGFKKIKRKESEGNDANGTGQNDRDNSQKRFKSSGRHLTSSLFTCNPGATANDFELEPKHDFTPSNGVEDDQDGFSGLGLYEGLGKHLHDKLSFNSPSEIQRKVLNHFKETGCKKGDLIIQSETGSGKTLAFLLPVINDLLQMTVSQQMERSVGTMALILCPTRELSVQVHSVLEKIMSFSYKNRWIVTGLLTGGEKKKSEKARLRKGVNILVSTPGRLLDHLKTTKSFEFGALKWLVLDEADRFTEEGMKESMTAILDLLMAEAGSNSLTRVRKFRMILCSATIDSTLKKMGNIHLENTQFIQKDSSDMTIVPNQLKPYFIICPAKLRLISFCAFLSKQFRTDRASEDLIQKKKIIVFVSTCDSVDFHTALLSDEHSNTLVKDVFGEGGQFVKIFKLHGNIPHKDRMATYKSFVQSNPAILFTTDVAARGLDFSNVELVIQYDAPTDSKSALHRMGRTARIGFNGSAYFWLLPDEKGYIKYLSEEQGTTGEIGDPLKLLQEWPLAVSSGNSKKVGFKEVATKAQIFLERKVANNPQLKNAAVRAFKSFVRAYSTFPSDLKKIFHVKGLHLGHLSKSFGLKDAPSKFNK